MAIVVEFYGIPRTRAGVSQAQVFSERASVSLGDILEEVASRFPEFGSSCVDGRRLREGYIVSIDGNQFARESDTLVSSGQSVLILSADAGG